MERKLIVEAIPGVARMEFWIQNERPMEEIHSGFIKYAYHQIIFGLLILATDHSQLSQDESFDYTESLEENILFLAPGTIILVAEKRHEFRGITEHLADFYPIISNVFGIQWHSKIRTNHSDWISIRNSAQRFLTELGIPVTTKLEEYEESYVGDISFLD